MTRSDIEQIILSEVKQRAALLGFPATDVHAGLDLMRSGLYDSMAFIDLIVAMEEKTGVEIDLETIAPKDIATPGKLCDIIYRQHG
ncbi:MAG: acyl carrier protein [Bacteroidetes bacterium]|nr:acyl carrier protein [Bacteroidota bacterium]